MARAERQVVAGDIAQLRAAAKLSQAELAERVGVSRQAVSNIERGSSVPNGKLLAAIMGVLGVQDAPVFEVETERWLTEMGMLLQQVPESVRADVMDHVVRMLADAGSKSGAASAG